MIAKATDKKLLISETFFSIQGEGHFTGKSAYFIRFAGCDIGCAWCDTKDAWSAENSDSLSIGEIIDQANTKKTDYVVITGGEPFLHNLDIITKELYNAGKFIHIETSGAYPIKNAIFDWLSLSPKQIMPPKSKNYQFASELKVIVQDFTDIAFAEQEKEKVSDGCLLYLQPQWENSEVVLPMIIDYIQEHPEWELSLQVHKYLNIK